MAPTSTRLLVLGVVRELGPVHGYDVRRELLSWQADSWASIAPGSIYNSLKTLVREELVEVVGTDRQGARPERTTYRLTEAGEQEFTRLLRDNLSRSALPNHPLLVGLAFIPDAPEEELAVALRQRADDLRARLEQSRLLLDKIVSGASGIPAHVAESYRLNAALLEAEASWAEEYATRLTLD
jgi:DNA-binding PadR family transcriptional regulator